VVGEVRSKSRDLGDDRGYRVAVGVCAHSVDLSSGAEAPSLFGLFLSRLKPRPTRLGTEEKSRSLRCVSVPVCFVAVETASHEAQKSEH
jgi:hypothetical protein